MPRRSSRLRTDGSLQCDDGCTANSDVLVALQCLSGSEGLCEANLFDRQA